MRIFSSQKFDVIIDKFQLPNGKEIEKAYVKHRGSVVIVPFIDKEKIIMIKQYRPIIGKWLIELPAGTVEEKENEEETARRELEEEIGYKPNFMSKIFSFYVSPGVTTEIMHVYIARDLVKTSQNLEEYEVIEPFEIRFEDAVKMVLDGKIEDGKTMLSLLLISQKYRDLLTHQLI
ncbi:NUDIX hydrolase [Sulfurisphaera tokodaii]|uniref:ADP-ribose pyrophosphatase n=2 Tax=Sulfurisphaera tokodaii TaxID=111955 RepID=F9VP98_SULTO|nr:NUDIX hydrolase [Sulfurisphaera tokodaii]BAK54745.1 ADP-ribose pyrophosphatase [Sulfurisphaera tokodaii str. 7]HII72985.1 NUDIX hydrolase [Sulfurisphaera tokodaii]